VKPCGAAVRASAAHPGLVQVDAAGAGGAEPGRQRQLIEGAIGQEADVGAVQGGGEPADHAGQADDDLGEVVQAAAAAQLFGVVHGGLDAQYVLAFGAGLELEQAETDPEPAQAVPSDLTAISTSPTRSGRDAGSDGKSTSARMSWQRSSAAQSTLCRCGHCSRFSGHQSSLRHGPYGGVTLSCWMR
jgi:hypothetical protein